MGWPRALAARRHGWSLPYWMANGIGFSLEHGYRLLRRTTGLSAPPLLSRQAVQVLGNNQDFSNAQSARDARLGAARRLSDRPRGDRRVAARRVPRARLTR